MLCTNVPFHIYIFKLISSAESILCWCAYKLNTSEISEKSMNRSSYIFTLITESKGYWTLTILFSKNSLWWFFFLNLQSNIRGLHISYNNKAFWCSHRMNCRVRRFQLWSREHRYTAFRLIYFVTDNHDVRLNNCKRGVGQLDIEGGSEYTALPLFVLDIIKMIFDNCIESAWCICDGPVFLHTMLSNTSALLASGKASYCVRVINSGLSCEAGVIMYTSFRFVIQINIFYVDYRQNSLCKSMLSNVFR